MDGEHRVYVLFRRESYAVGIGLENRCSALDGAEYTAVLRHSALKAERHRHRDILYLFRFGNARGVAESAGQEYCGDYRRCADRHCKLPEILANRLQIPARNECVGKICREHDGDTQKRGERSINGGDSGFRFKENPEGEFINTSNKLRIPPLTAIRDLMYASQEIEKSEELNLLPDKKWLIQLIQPGTSLGGARPKASVTDERGILYIAKFPSRKDDYDVGLWEHFCHLLAAKAGIRVASTRVLVTENKYHTLLSERFDRRNDGKRIHFASAMTLTGLTDGANAATGNGYLDIVDFIIQGCTNVEANLQELYRRVAFNICVGNTDDHFRNHGFLLTPRGWTLSPAYDMNPTLNNQQSLLISESSCESDLVILIDACENYMLSRDTAEKIISEVVDAMKDWRRIAIRLNISKREIDLFSQRFDTYSSFGC